MLPERFLLLARAQKAGRFLVLDDILHSGFLAYTCPKQTFPTQASPQPLGDHGIALHMNCELVRGKLLPVTPRSWIGLTLGVEGPGLDNSVFDAVFL